MVNVYSRLIIKLYKVIYQSRLLLGLLSRSLGRSSLGFLLSLLSGWFGSGCFGWFLVRLLSSSSFSLGSRCSNFLDTFLHFGGSSDRVPLSTSLLLRLG